MDSHVDAVVIGGGFYGTAIAVHLVKQHGLRRVLLVEKECQLLKRASYNNQARVHNGYHYPRSFTTAYRSRVNLPRFISNWSQAIKSDFIHLYAVARRNSKVTAKQFERFCREIGANLQLASSNLSALFEPKLIEKVFLVEEPVFDASVLAKQAIRELNENDVKILFNMRAICIKALNANQHLVTLQPSIEEHHHNQEVIMCDYVFNCTYSGLSQFNGDFPELQIGLKQELTEMALIQVPPILETFGVTVMDGPFFSMMPFPARGLHTLSHVRYTPHFNWIDKRGIDPYQKQLDYNCVTHFDFMIRDVARYFPIMSEAKYVDSLFEVKTVLAKNEVDDGRPIFFEKNSGLPNCYSILGSKIDNIYDVLERIDAEFQ